MLYNVLPPLIFFMSLGGIIIIISRVVVRLRRQQLAYDLQSHVTRVAKTRLSKIQDLAGLLAPNQNSVQRFKNRLSLLVHNIKQTWRKTWQDMAEWRQRRARRANKTAVPNHRGTAAHPPTSINLAATAGQTSVQPPRSLLRSQLAAATSRAKQLTSHSVAKLKQQTTTILPILKQKLHSLPISSAQPPTIDQSPPSTKSTSGDQPTAKKTKPSPVLRIVNTNHNHQPDVKPSPVIKQMGQPVKAGSISRLFKKEGKKSALKLAAEALAKLQADKAESLLVPYLVRHPKDTNAYMMLGKAAVCRHAWNEATEIYEQVIKLKPDTEGCYAALGQAALAAGNLTKAIETLQRAHDQNPRNISVIKCLLQIAQRMDNLPMQKSLNAELQQLEQAKTSIPSNQSVNSPQ